MNTAKIRELPPEQRVEVDDSAIDAETIKRRNEEFMNAIAQLSEEAFRSIWDNPKDADYDDL
jgi:hypothetical protein